MSRQTWVEAYRTAKAAGSNLSNSSTATSIIAVADKITLPANFFEPGRVVRVTATGRISNLVTTPGTLTLDLRLGAVVAFNGAAMQLSTTAHTTLPWWLEMLLTCRAEGQSTTATLIGLAKFTSQAASISTSDSTSTHSTLLNPNVTPVVGTGFDSTSAQTVDLFAKFSIADSANLIACEQFVFEALN